jgi:hypothetical protein
MMCRDIKLLCLVTVKSHDVCTTAYYVSALSSEGYPDQWHDGVLMNYQCYPCMREKCRSWSAILLKQDFHEPNAI